MSYCFTVNCAKLSSPGRTHALKHCRRVMNIARTTPTLPPRAPARCHRDQNRGQEMPAALNNAASVQHDNPSMLAGSGSFFAVHERTDCVIGASIATIACRLIQFQRDLSGAEMSVAVLQWCDTMPRTSARTLSPVSPGTVRRSTRSVQLIRICGPTGTTADHRCVQRRSPNQADARAVAALSLSNTHQVAVSNNPA